LSTDQNFKGVVRDTTA